MPIDATKINGTKNGKLPQRLLIEEIGLTGLERQGGLIYEEFLPELQGFRWLNILKEMSTQDAVITAILHAIEMLVRQVQYSVVPTSDDLEDQRCAEFIGGALFDDMSTTWQDKLSEILTMITYGWAYLEVVYKRRLGDNRDPRRKSKFDDGLIGWRKWSIRAQESFYEWQFDDHGGIQGLWQQPAPNYKLYFIPIQKALLFRTTTRKGNPEGMSTLRGAYRSYYFAKHIENIEGIATERELTGLPVIWLPAEYMYDDSTDEQKAIYALMKQIAVNVRMDEQAGLALPLQYDSNGNPLFKFELLTASGTRTMDTDKIIRRYNQQKAMSVLADFILIGHDGVGSLALSESKTNLFSLALGAYLDSIVDVVNNHAIPQLLKLNGMMGKCKLIHGDVESVSLKDLGDYINRLSGAGFDLAQIEGLQDHLLNVANLPVGG